MSTLDPRRVALVVAGAAASSPRGRRELVGTGYFLTEQLLLTAGHVVDGAATFEVRRAGDGPEEGLFHRASLAWRGPADLDAALLRVDHIPGTWPLPHLVPDATDGHWRSAGYAAGAADEATDSRRTLPLEGTFSLS